MSDVPAALNVDAPLSAQATPWWIRAAAQVEQWLLRATDRANPILVKETRQALKSRQFVISFLVVLVGCWIVTLGGVAVIGPRIYFGATGREMLIAYYCVLAAPLAVIVPYSAYRSIAIEKEENTYDLLSITTLGPRQIITGKLCSAGAQMLVFFSAVAPCIAFTFLLRGVDAISVAVLLVLALLGSLGLSMAALLVGTLAQARYTQVIISVGLVLALVGAFWGAVGIAVLVLYEPIPYADPEFWLVSLLLLTFYATTFGLLHAAAAARIAFPSENRSTPLRWWMTVQQACFVAWFAGICFYDVVRSPGRVDLTLRLIGDGLVFLGMIGTAYWYLMGTLLTSEWPHLSRRVQRSLPQGAAERMFLSWLNPGPGAGYVFAVSNYGMLCLAGTAALLVLGAWDGWNNTPPSFETALYFFAVSWAYLTTFLGVGRLLIGLFRRFAFVPLAAGFLTHLILLLTGIGVPLLIYLMSSSSRYFNSYSLSQITNPAITLGSLVDDGPAAIDAPVVAIILMAAAVVTLLLNARSIATELHRQRTPAPLRIVEDEQQTAPAAATKPQSPWDVEGPSFEAEKDA